MFMVYPPKFWARVPILTGNILGDDDRKEKAQLVGKFERAFAEWNGVNYGNDIGYRAILREKP